MDVYSNIIYVFVFILYIRTPKLTNERTGNVAKKKFYVVWKGVNPGVYDNWRDCKLQVEGYDNALYKSFATQQEAEDAFSDSPDRYIGNNQSKKKVGNILSNANIIHNSLSVDAACSGNPGAMEYQGVYVKTGELVFHQGPFKVGTNNIGEFLALVHALALLKQKGADIPIYSDSRNAIKWVKEKKCKTKLERNSTTEGLFRLIDRAEDWLKKNSYTTQVIKWETDQWGEIPADFGRK